MTLKDPFVEAFLDACYEGDLSKTQEAIASGRLTSEELDEGLAEATAMVHTDLVPVLFDAGASVSTKSVAALRGDSSQQHPTIVRLFFDHGLDPNATDSSGDPILAYVLAIILYIRIKVQLSIASWKIPNALVNSSHGALILTASTPRGRLASLLPFIAFEKMTPLYLTCVSNMGPG